MRTICKQEGITLIIILMGLFLNQAHIIFDVNFSLADFFCGLAVLLLVFKNRLRLPSAPTMFFLLVSVSVIFTTAFYVPRKFAYNPDFHVMIIGYLKLLAVFVYFLMGYNIANLKLTDKTLQGYALFALGIAMIGVIITVFKLRPFAQILFFDETRFKGLMNDPNYFAVVQLTALVYFSRTEKINTLFKSVAVLFIVISVLISGSKTGIVTFFCYLIFRVVEYLIKAEKKLSTFIVRLFFVILLVAAVPVALSIGQNLINHLTAVIPAWARIETVFTDFKAAIFGGESSRDLAWEIALEMIKASPVIGIGVGIYPWFAKQCFETGVIAHNTYWQLSAANTYWQLTAENTYLQLAAEWGLPLAIIFFSYLFYVISKATFSRKNKGETDFILRDILIIFLISSLAISLNHARLFWVVLGAFMVKIRGVRG